MGRTGNTSVIFKRLGFRCTNLTLQEEHLRRNDLTTFRSKLHPNSSVAVREGADRALHVRYVNAPCVPGEHFYPLVIDLDADPADYRCDCLRQDGGFLCHTCMLMQVWNGVMVLRAFNALGCFQEELRVGEHCVMMASGRKGIHLWFRRGLPVVLHKAMLGEDAPLPYNRAWGGVDTRRCHGYLIGQPVRAVVALDALTYDQRVAMVRRVQTRVRTECAECEVYQRLAACLYREGADAHGRVVIDMQPLRPLHTVRCPGQPNFKAGTGCVRWSTEVTADDIRIIHVEMTDVGGDGRPEVNSTGCVLRAKTSPTARTRVSHPHKHTLLCWHNTSIRPHSLARTTVPWVCINQTVAVAGTGAATCRAISTTLTLKRHSRARPVKGRATGETR